MGPARRRGMARTAIVAAVKDEVARYVARHGFRAADRDGESALYRSPDEPDTVVVVSGVGREAAMSATAKVLETLAPSLIVSTGFAGAVRPELKTGDLVVCEQVSAAHGPMESWSVEASPPSHRTDEGSVRTAISVAARKGLPAAIGTCLTVPGFVFRPEDKRSIGDRFPVSVVDMESYWTTKLADEQAVPCIVVRAVLDLVDQPLPSLVAGLAGDGRRAWPTTLAHVGSRPWEVPGLLRLARQARIARASITSFLEVFVQAERRSDLLVEPAR